MTEMEELYIGTDIGTTSTKSVAFNRQGKAIYEAAKEYDLHTPNEFVAEQDPDEVFEAVVETLQHILKQVDHPKQIKFVSFSSAMHSIIGLNKELKRITQSITWADTRSNEVVERLIGEGKADAIYQKTGVPIHPMTPFSKIIWLRERDAEQFEKISKFISIKEYVCFKLFNQFVVDQSIAASSGFLNLHTLDWDDELLLEMQITREQLSAVVSTTYDDFELQERWKEQLDFDAGTKFIIGSSDGVLANLGLFAIKKGTVAVTIGTSGAIRLVHNQALLDKEGRTFCYPLVENHWTIGGPVNNGGVILKWAKNELAQSESRKAELLNEDAYAYVTRMAQSVSPGANGILFHPYLLGERAPIWDAEASGSFTGLRMHHKKADLLRAVMEGILFNLREVLEIIEDQGGVIERVYASGGFAKSETWRQMMADIFQLNILIPESCESSCFGAVLLGLLAIKEISSFEEVESLVHLSNEHIPNHDLAETYDNIFVKYSKIGVALRSID